MELIDDGKRLVFQASETGAETAGYAALIAMIVGGAMVLLLAGLVVLMVMPEKGEPFPFMKAAVAVAVIVVPMAVLVRFAMPQLFVVKNAVASGTVTKAVFDPREESVRLRVRRATRWAEEDVANDAISEVTLDMVYIRNRHFAMIGLRGSGREPALLTFPSEEEAEVAFARLKELYRESEGMAFTDRRRGD
ncbi:hypothetical protein HK107_02335 [Parvularcula sp. ZS-1/3]|uniref:Uncharacterized protein n=1 Tax=Parvularcula mediterranea TaxID=2732508 RepID=A0A7Y3RKR2_9PROT|nr:hypothetical protein [Parvularcula mediterranea]NNU15162.1 hypothetical protein [Parvularcula mediterranea]